MPSGIYKRTKGNHFQKGCKIRVGMEHSEETKRKIALSKTGVKQSLLHIKNRIVVGNGHYLWKGDGVGYRGLHYWVIRQLGKPNYCEECGDDSLRPRQYQWANVSGSYKRIVTDWRRLCVKCHKTFDRVKSVKILTM